MRCLTKCMVCSRMTVRPRGAISEEPRWVINRPGKRLFRTSDTYKRRNVVTSVLNQANLVILAVFFMSPCLGLQILLSPT